MRIAIGMSCLLLGFALSHTWGQAPGSADAKNARPGSDHQLVERVLGARREYREALEALRAFYVATGDIERARWAEEELITFHRIPKQAFLLELDVPPPNLRGDYNIPEANELYKQAMDFKQRGGWGTTLIDNLKRAELLLQRLLSKYPQSDKISDTAYQLGDIYESSAYKQFARSAKYFERCFQWNSKTHYDARLRAARLYERTLNDRTRAIEIYRQITTHETDPRRIEEAQRKLTELGGSNR